MKHLIQLWPGDWVKQTTKINLSVGEENNLNCYGGKNQLVCTFRRQYLWRFIGLILSKVTYGRNGHKTWAETKRSVDKKVRTKLHRDVCGNADLMKVRCDIYCNNYYYAFH